MNAAQKHLAGLYDEAKARVGRSLTVYNEVSDMLDQLEDNPQLERTAAYDQLCHRLRFSA